MHAVYKHVSVHIYDMEKIITVSPFTLRGTKNQILRAFLPPWQGFDLLYSRHSEHSLIALRD